METIIPGPEMDQFGNSNDPFFSFSQFDLDLQHQAQAAIQQQQQHQEQPQQPQQPQRSVQELWQDFDCYLPIDCQSFVMTEPTTSMNASNMDSTATLPDTSTSYSALNNAISKLHFEPTIETMPSNDFTTTSMAHTQWSPQDIAKQEYSSPAQHSDTSSPLQHADLMPSISSTSQQNASTNSTIETTSTPTSMPASQSPLPLVANPDLADIIAGINWNLPTLQQTDSNKVPIHRLKPATEIQTSPSSSTDISGGVGKQKKTAHNAIERRYRNNINDRITELKNAVPALLHAKLKEKGGRAPVGSSSNKRSSMLDDDEDDVGDDDGEEYLDGVAVATKLNKATILHKATEYIHHLKRTNNDRKLENDALQHLLAQLPGGQQVLAHYQVQKLQREQMMQQQLAMERQYMKQDQQNRKKATAGKRKRANRRQLSYNNNDDFFDNGSLSSDHPNTPPSDHDTGLANNRVFMALFMAIAFFSSSPLTTPAGSEHVNNHNHVSRTASEQLIIGATTLNSTESFNSHQYATKDGNTLWVPWMDGWSVLRLIIFIGCLIQLLSPYIKNWIFGNSFKIRRVRSPTKSRRLLRSERQSNGKFKNVNVNNNKATESPSMSPGDEKCIRMTQLLTHSISIDHNDTSVTLSRKNKFGLLSSLIKELVLFMARHVFGYTIIACIQGDLDEDDDWGQQDNVSRWKHAFKWVKLNECECLGGNPVLSRLGMLHHSVRMLNLVDALQDGDDDDDERQQQLSSMRARAYATATMQISLGLPCAYLTNWMADYLWGMAMNDANDEDPWASLADDDDEQTSSTMAILSTKLAWTETLDVIRNQMPTARPANKNAADLSLSAYAPTLVPTAILFNLHLLDQLASDFQTLIDTMMTTLNPTDKQPNPSLSSVFVIHPHSVKDDTTRVANWFTCVGATVEALWQGDVARAETNMLALAQQVPRAMTVPIHRRSLKKKERQCELDGLVKQQVVHMLAGATLVLQKQDAAGIEELEIGERFRHQRTKRAAALVGANELEATHVEGRVMALAEFAVMLVTLKAWISAWPVGCNNNVGMAMEETKDAQVRLVSLSLRRMVCRPALAGRLKTQQMVIDRLDRLGRYVEEASHHGLDGNGSPSDSVNGYSDVECNDDGDDDKERPGAIKQDKLVNHLHKMMAIIQGN